MAVFSRQDLVGEQQVYRTTGSLVAWWTWTVFAAVLLVLLALGHRDHAALATAFVVIAITGIMYACALRPRIVASAAGITVVNPLRVHTVPWSALTGVDLVHNVCVHYPGPAGEKVVHSWAVQSSGRSRTRNELRARRAARRGLAPAPGYARLPDAAQAALAGSAAEFIARQLDERARRERPAATPGPAAGVVPGAAPGGAPAPDSGQAAETAPASDPGAAPGAVQVRWTWGPIAAMVVPLLILLVVLLA